MQPCSHAVGKGFKGVIALKMPVNLVIGFEPIDSHYYKAYRSMDSDAAVPFILKVFPHTARVSQADKVVVFSNYWAGVKAQCLQ